MVINAAIARHVGEIGPRNGHAGAVKVIAVIVPAPADLTGGGNALLCDVLTDVINSPLIGPGDPNGGRKAQRPPGKVIDGPAALRKPLLALSAGAWAARLAALRGNHSAAVETAQAVVHQPVKVDCAILVTFGHKDVFEAGTPDMIVEPRVEPPGNLPHVVAVNLLR